MSTSPASTAALRRAAILRYVMIAPFFMLVFFLPAGTFDYWQAWAYLAVLLGLMAITLNYLLANRPDLMERRMRLREREAPQARVIAVSAVYFAVVFLLPGFDRRFGWSNVPVAVSTLALALVAAGYGIVMLVFRENRYTTRTVEVEEGQTVVSTGPYAVVRHPMYVGMALLSMASPLALGSWWAFLPSVLIVPILAARILNEEAVLQRELKGYPEYMAKTKRRLIPGVW